MFTEGLGLYSFRLYLSWVLTAFSGIAIVLASIALLLSLDNLYEPNEHALLLLSPPLDRLRRQVQPILRRCVSAAC